MGKILIKNGRIWNGEEFLNGDILTNDNKIEKIESYINENADYVFDATGKIVSSGLVDIHTHFKGVSSDVFGISAEMSCLPFGVTTANDAGGSMGDKALLESFDVRGTVFTSADIWNNKANFDNAEKQLLKFGDKALGIKVYFDGDISEVEDEKPLIEVCSFAREKGLKVMVHCSNTPISMEKIIEILSPGDILTHTFCNCENSCIKNNFRALSLAKEKGIVIDAGFAGNVHTNFKNFEESVKNGFLPDTISTDITSHSAYKRGGKYGMTMCMSIAGHLGMSEEEIFRAVTSTPAKALNKERECGFLGVGKCADISVFDYTDEGFELTDKANNHIESKTGYRCILTICNGVVLYKY